MNIYNTMILFESFNEIHKICQEYGIQNYTINTDGTIDVDGDVNLSLRRLTKLPVKFRNVTGDFNCNNSELTTLMGAPIRVGDNFRCYNNKLTTLEGAPKLVGGVFSCSFNELTTLVGSPQSVGRDFLCRNNNLTNLQGIPKSFSVIYCEGNPIYSSKYLQPYLEALKCINTDKEIPKELVTPGLMSFLKEIDTTLYNKIKTMFDQDTIDTIADIGDIGF